MTQKHAYERREHERKKNAEEVHDFDSDSARNRLAKIAQKSKKKVKKLMKELKKFRERK